MGVKKSIFEKLKLIEKIEEQSGTNIEESNCCEENKKDDIFMKIEAKEQMDFHDGTTVDDEDFENIKMREEHNENLSTEIVLTVDEIYKKFSLESNSTKTIFIVDEFFKALPVNLPTEVKKQSVANIITASNMDLKGILNDGDNRLHILDGFLKDFSRNTNESIIKYQIQIEQLTKEIESLKQLISKKERLQEEQKSIIEFEMQKIDSIINAIK